MHSVLSPSFPTQASNLAPRWTGSSGRSPRSAARSTLLVFALIAFFCIRYRRGSKRRAHAKARKARPRGLEIGWTVVPLLIFLALFVWAADVFFRMSKPPADAIEIYVVGKQWMWKIQHPDGRREINELHLPVGRPVKLVMTSQDVIHDFFVPGLSHQAGRGARAATRRSGSRRRSRANTISSARNIAARITRRWAAGFTSGAGGARPLAGAATGAGFARRAGRTRLSHARLQRLPRAECADSRAAARRHLRQTGAARRRHDRDARTTNICATRSCCRTNKSPPATSRSCRLFKAKSARKI